MPKRVYFSFDYDGCSAILFKEIFESVKQDIIKDQRLSDFQRLVQFDKVFTKMENAKECFEGFIKDRSKDATKVRLYVGSNRQSHGLDKANQDLNNNGSCFKNFAKYVEDKNAENKGSESDKWIFCPLLLADRYDEYGGTRKEKVGTAMNLKPELDCEFDALKVKTIKMQIDHIAKMAKKYPDDQHEFYFLDDDYKDVILKALYHNFVDGDFPKNISIHLVKYDWHGYVFEGAKSPFIGEADPIQGKKSLETLKAKPEQGSNTLFFSRFFGSMFAAAESPARQGKADEIDGVGPAESQPPALEIAK